MKKKVKKLSRIATGEYRAKITGHAVTVGLCCSPPMLRIKLIPTDIMDAVSGKWRPLDKDFPRNFETSFPLLDRDWHPTAHVEDAIGVFDWAGTDFNSLKSASPSESVRCTITYKRVTIWTPHYDPHGWSVLATTKSYRWQWVVTRVYLL